MRSLHSTCMQSCGQARCCCGSGAWGGSRWSKRRVRSLEGQALPVLRGHICRVWQGRVDAGGCRWVDMLSCPRAAASVLI